MISAKNSRRDFMKIVGGGVASISVLSAGAKNSITENAKGKPNIIIIMTDQQRADLSAREGFPFDTTPFLDSMAKEGTWFNRAYTTMPACVPARTSLFTGRYPNANRVRSNHNANDVLYDRDLIDVLKEQGYALGLSGKNHCYLTQKRFDHWYTLGHNGGGQPDRTAQEKKFDTYLTKLQHRAAMEPTPFPLECQCPHRSVSKSIEWINQLDNQPFFLWLSFPEPHNPYQAPEPYFSMFPPESLPPTRSGTEALKIKGFKFEWTRQQFDRAFPDFSEQIPRGRSNYLGMLRLIDDQIKRLVDFLKEKDLKENTLIVFVSDHGDFVGEYGLLRKGPELPELLTRVPLFFNGPGVERSAEPHSAHVSIVDIFPTLCDALGIPLPKGVQGRSLWPMLTGKEYPKEEFESVYAEHGFGGLHYTAEDTLDPVAEGALNAAVSFDCLNSWSQSGTMRMVRKGDWKLISDMQGKGQLYNIVKDPIELDNLYGKPEYAAVQLELLEELLAWTLRTQDSLPYPQRRYVMKTDPKNYWAPYREKPE